MVIKKIESTYIANHSIVGEDYEGKPCNLENWEYRCPTIEEATEEATKYLESRNIQEEIIYEDVADGEPTPTE